MGSYLALDVGGSFVTFSKHHFVDGILYKSTDKSQITGAEQWDSGQVCCLSIGTSRLPHSSELTNVTIESRRDRHTDINLLLSRLVMDDVLPRLSEQCEMDILLLMNGGGLTQQNCKWASFNRLLLTCPVPRGVPAGFCFTFHVCRPMFVLLGSYPWILPAFPSTVDHLP